MSDQRITDRPRTLEDRQAEWLEQSGAFITPAEREFVVMMRSLAERGVGYGWMQQHIEWEWQAKGPGAWGPEYFERRIMSLEAQLSEARKDAER